MTTYDWRTRHNQRRSSPITTEEKRVATLLVAVNKSIDYHLEGGGGFPDANTSEAYGQIIEGVVTLLNEGVGGLDAGRLWDECAGLAEKVCWDLDMSEVAWS